MATDRQAAYRRQSRALTVTRILDSLKHSSKNTAPCSFRRDFLYLTYYRKIKIVTIVTVQNNLLN